MLAINAGVWSTENCYVERPVGSFQLNMVKLWNDLFFLCEKHELRILLTPFDTFWMWIRWKKHPYNHSNGSICTRRSHWLLCLETLAAIKGRLTFATHRWDGNGVPFAWGIWNEIHPARARNNTDIFYKFIEELSTHLRELEMKLYERSHLQTVSLFGPVLQEHRYWLMLFFVTRDWICTTHFYDAAINYPKDTVA